MAFKTSTPDSYYKFWHNSPFYDPDNPSRPDVANIFLPQYVFEEKINFDNRLNVVYEMTHDEKVINKYLQKLSIGQVASLWQHLLSLGGNQKRAFKNIRNHIETDTEIEDYKDNIYPVFKYNSCVMEALLSSIAVIYVGRFSDSFSQNPNKFFEEMSREEQHEAWNDISKISDILAKKFLDPNNGGYILNGCAIDMVSDCVLQRIRPSWIKDAPLSLAEYDKNNYWSIMSEKTKNEMKHIYCTNDIKKTSLYKALDRYNDRCLLADTLSKIFFVQPLSATLTGKKSITDEMINLNTNIIYNVDGKWREEELGNIINNALTLPNEIPIDKNIVKMLHDINRKLTPVYISNNIELNKEPPTREDYDTILNCVAQVAFTNPNKHDILNRYTKFDSPTKDTYTLGENNTVKKATKIFKKANKDSAKGR